MQITDHYLTEPYEWQREACKTAFSFDHYALLAEMGTGKTKCMIDILRHKYAANGRIMRTLIFSPIVTLVNWKKEFGIHSKIPQKNIIVLNKSSKRLKEFKARVKEDSIVVVNYESVGSKLFYSALELWGPEIVVGDEMHLLKSPKSKRAKAIIKLSDKADYRYGMTGTPILNSPMDIFNQWRFLDKGETFGKSFFKFRAEYFQDANASWAHTQNHFPKWEPIPSKFPEMTDKIQAKSIRKLKKDCMDLPPLIKEVVPLSMDKDQEKAYKEMRDLFITFVESKKEEPKAVVAQLALTKALRLQQICSGFVITDDNEVVRLKSNAKMDWIKEYIPTLTDYHKVIIWTAFKEDLNMINEYLAENNIAFRSIYGGQDMGYRQEGIDDFNNSDSVRVMVANRSAGGIGINLVASDYSVVYSRNFKLADELQSEARNHRGGSQIHNKITQINLCIENTMDEKVVEALVNKKDISNQIIDVIKNDNN